uniref:Cytochrome P450 n=2 Tax=Hymenolepis diminuta TaxID=6216 RepID=A0A0R3STZ4_HYMDI
MSGTKQGELDEDKPPYHAFFTDNKSTDIVLKVVFNIFSFVGIILCIAWISSLQIVPVVNEMSIAVCDFADLFQSNIISKLSSVSKATDDYSVVSSYIGSKIVVVISKWAKIEDFRCDLKLRKYFTKCPNSFCSKWQGLMFSDPFSVDHSRLAEFFDFVSQTISTNLFIGASVRGTDHFLKVSPSRFILTDENVDRLVLTILFQAILHHEMDEKSCCEVLLKLDELSRGLLSLHTTGILPKPFQSIGIKWITEGVNQLFQPFIIYHLDHNRNIPPKTLLSHILVSKRKLSLSNIKSEDVEGFLTTSHLSHLLFECFFIGHHSLLPCLRIILEALKNRSIWAKRVADDLTNHQKSCPFSYCKHTTGLTEECLELDSGCLPFCKDLCLEALRFVVSGWPLGCVRESYRDGDGYLAGDLILFNEPAVFHDKSIWYPHKPCNTETDLHSFLPFGRHGCKTSNSLTSRVILNSKIVFMPRFHIYRILLATIVHLFTKCSIKTDSSSDSIIEDEFANLPLYLPTVSEFSSSTELYKNDL